MQNAECKMQNEQRLIDATALFRELLERQYSEQTMGIVASYYPQMRAIVAQAPTVDAVEVVRCKDCKHWKPIHEHIPHMECNIFCGAYEHGYPTNADDFCSYGERREGE